MTQLRAWQVEAFDAWRAAGHRGIVEAVTGTGKTRVGIAAMVAARSMQQQIFVVVPTIDPLEQWFTETKQLLPSVSVGRRGNGHKDDFRHSSILIQHYPFGNREGCSATTSGSFAYRRRSAPLWHGRICSCVQ